MNKQVNTEFKRLMKLYENLPSNKMEVVVNLIQNAAFMEVTLRKLQTEIEKSGPVIETTNGNGFRVTTESAAQKSYNTMIKNYSGIVTKLADLLPAESKGTKLEELMRD